MFWYFLRNTLYYCFQLYFKRQRIDGKEHLRQKGPMFIAMNHPNAFMDPISFATFLFYPRTYYMARGDAFKKGAAAFLLQSMGIVPIFRLRDGGYENVKKNLESFKMAYSLLDRNKKIMVFAEGLSIKERRLRSIQKGTAKMSFGYLEQGGNFDLKIVPVVINYSEPEKFRPYVYFKIAEPIAVKDFYEDYKKQPAQTIVKLTSAIEERMRPMMPSLLNKENDVLIEQLQPILKRQYMENKNLDYHDPAQQQKYWEFVIDRLNKTTEEDAQKLRNATGAYTRELHELNLRDHLVYSETKNKSLLTLGNFLLFIFGFPFYLVGKILNFPAYYLAQGVARKKVKNIEFKASVTFGAGALLLNIFFLVELLIVWLVWHKWQYLLLYTGVKAACGYMALLYSPFRKKMMGALRFSGLKKRDPSRLKSLLNQRAEILAFIGNFS